MSDLDDPNNEVLVDWVSLGRGGIAQAQSFAREPWSGALETLSRGREVVPAQII